jgi:hypothetical protein
MSAVSLPRINRRKISITSLQDQSGDKAYWLSQTPYQRLKAVETLRQINKSAAMPWPIMDTRAQRQTWMFERKQESLRQI